MADWARVTLQARGKIRRFIEGKRRTPEETEALLARRKGDCNRCGACCKIVFRCPFLGTDAQGGYICRIYEYRFTQCRLFPMHEKDLLELEEKCSYTFEPAAEGASVPAAD
jgi:Fe-S-cluster containining protein